MSPVWRARFGARALSTRRMAQMTIVVPVDPPMPYVISSQLEVYPNHHLLQDRLLRAELVYFGMKNKNLPARRNPGGALQKHVDPLNDGLWPFPWGFKK
ncbi:Uncharacterized protein PBTT_03789 [Plasmodiophora brassicae]|uniref:Uncharacterized protein n=1 Tax=Plasmodiophora brassicae TaxID=37360 RepID=A0A0G4ISE2_PLABS|nr:hypothetical protein PBRA_006269 [Plasmodiophora brassicae]SPQ96026.1 unnamed protein product [Plasmodiophora brassicae]